MESEIDDLRAAYDREMRAEPAAEAGLRYEHVGPLVRAVGEGDCCILFSDFGDFGGVTAGREGAPEEAASEEAKREEAGREIDRAIAAQIAFCAANGLALEWKLYGHDRPADLAARLAAAGLIADEPEWLMALLCESRQRDRKAEQSLDTPGLIVQPEDDLPLPAGYRLERVVDDEGLARFARASSVAFERDERGRVEAFRARLGDPSLVLYVVMHGDEPVASARLDMPDGRRFASLWGGGIVPAHRRRGLYRALVAIRAADARARGYRVLTVDARQTSRPILARLGFVTLATVQGWLLPPPHASA